MTSAHRPSFNDPSAPAIRRAAACAVEALEGRVLLASTGLAGAYYANANLSGSPVATRVDKTVNFNWGGNPGINGVPADNFSVRWQGYLVAPRRGTYTLTIHADDGARLYLDGKLLIDRWGAAGRGTADVVLDGKPRLLRLEHNEGTGTASVAFGWSQKGGFAEQTVPMEALYHDLKQEKGLAR